MWFRGYYYALRFHLPNDVSLLLGGAKPVAHRTHISSLHVTVAIAEVNASQLRQHWKHHNLDLEIFLNSCFAPLTILFRFRCEMDWKTTNIRKGDWDWIRNGRTPRFFVRLQATNESGHLSSRCRDHPPVFVPRSCADHSWQLGGRIHTTRFKCKFCSIYKSTKSTKM